MAGRDPERIADTMRRVSVGSAMLRIAPGNERYWDPEMLTVAADELDRMREYLLETSGRLHQLASDHHELTEDDMRELADDMARMANRRDEPRKQKDDTE